MQCYFCKNSLELNISNFNACQKCIKCNLLYIKSENIDSYIKIFLYNNFNITNKYSTYINKKLIENSLFIFVKNNISLKRIPCKLIKNFNRKKCDIIKYKLNGFKFYNCNYKEYFCFYEKDLKKYLKRFIFKCKFEYNMNIIRNKVKALFIQED